MKLEGDNGAAAPPTKLALKSRPESLTRNVFEAIREGIIDKSLPPGVQVTEKSLAAQLNVSKTPVREALLQLRQAGLIEDWGRRGGKIVSPSARLIREIAETREAIEVFLAGRTAKIASDAQRQQIMDLAQKSRDAAVAEDSDLYHEINMSFFLLLSDVIDNRMIRALVEKNLILGAVIRLRDYPSATPIEELSQGHMNIATAILEKSSSKAKAAARDRIRRTLKYNLEAFEEFGGA